MIEYDPSYFHIYAQKRDEFLVGLTLPSGNIRPPRPGGYKGWAAMIVNLKLRKFSGIGGAASMIRPFQFSTHVKASPEEIEEVLRIAWHTQKAILNDPDIEITTTDLNFVPIPLDRWRISKPDHPARVRILKRREEIRRIREADERAEAMDEETGEQGGEVGG